MDNREYSMLLPEGETCGTCKHFSRCEWLLSRKTDSVFCDWFPIRFRAACDDPAAEQDINSYEIEKVFETGDVSMRVRVIKEIPYTLSYDAENHVYYAQENMFQCYGEGETPEHAAYEMIQEMLVYWDLLEEHMTPERMGNQASLAAMKEYLWREGKS